MKIEKNILALDELAETLESDDLDLDNAVETYGKAIKLAAETAKSLKTIEDKITVLQKQADTITETLHPIEKN